MKKRFYRANISPLHIPAIHRAKWPVALLSEGFVPFPKTAIRALSHLFGDSPAMEELAVLLAAIDYKRPRVTKALTLSYLAFTSGFSEEKTRAILEELVSKGFVAAPLDEKNLHLDLKGFYLKIANISLRGDVDLELSDDC